MFRTARHADPGSGFTQPLDRDSFRERQAADLARYEDADGEYVVRRRPFHERSAASSKRSRDRVYEIEDDEDESALLTEDDEREGASDGDADAGEEGWRNKEGERLSDFGVDEVADFYDEDDLPLAEIIRRRKAEA